MNVRRIVMMMLVFGCLVQGVSAATMNVTKTVGSTVGCNSFISNGFISDETIYYSVIFHFYATDNARWSQYTTSFGECVVSGDWGTTWTGIHSAGESHTMSGSFLFDGGWNNIQVLVGNSGSTSGYAIFSSEPLIYASGESCPGIGTFAYYKDDVLIGIDTDDWNYSFAIEDGGEYQIYFSGTDEWHNFTATASDHTWNPTCSLPSISGTITALDGEGIYNLNVTLNDWGSDVDSTFTDSNGSYRFYRADSGSTLFALSVSGYCNAGDDCTSFGFGTPFLLDNGTDRVVDYTWHIPQNVRIDLQYENGSAVSGALLNMKNLPGDVGVWKTTSTDGYTTFTSLQSSKVYVDYHGGDTGEAGSDALHSFQLTPNGQYRSSQFTVTIPDDFTNNTTIPVIPPPVVDDGNKTDITDMVGDSLFLVTVRDSETSAPLKDATVTVVAADKLNYTGQWTGYTNTSGQWSFSKNYTVGEYDVSVQLKCYFPQTTTRRASATFDLVYSCGAPPGTDDNGTGGWQDNDSNSDWTFNNSMETENDVKNKLNSILYIVGVILVIILFATYFVKK